MNKFIISIALGASALFATAASAAPLSHGVAVIPDNGIENVRMICNEDGRCWRERGQRRVIIDNLYNYAPRERYMTGADIPIAGTTTTVQASEIGVGPRGVGIGVGPSW